MQRRVVDAVRPDTLRLTPEQVRGRLGVMEGFADRMTLSIAEADQQLTGSGQLFETGEIDIPRDPRPKVWKNCPPTLRDILLLSRGHGEADFIVYEDERLTFEEHFRVSAHVGGILRRRFGIENGDRVGIAMRNLPEWSVAFWAAAVAGAVVVPLNAWWTGEELHYGLSDSGTKLVLCDEERAERLADYVTSCPTCGRSSWLAPAGTCRSRCCDSRRSSAWYRPTPTCRMRRSDPDDDATIFYTSGTTGRPKGALGTHRNICTNPMSMFYVATRTGLRDGTEIGGGPRLGFPALGASLSRHRLPLAHGLQHPRRAESSS